MTHMITRCPACGTCFRITEAQLNTAKGAVRCGSCLQIFKALDNRVAGSGPPQRKPNTSAKAVAGAAARADQAGPAVASAKSATPSLTPVAMKEDEDDLLISDEMLLDDDDEEGSSFLDDDLNTSFLKMSGWKPSHTSLFEREPKAPEDEDDETGEELDESWAINLLEDDEPAVAATSKAKQDNPPAPARKPLADAPQSKPPATSDAPRQEPELGPAIDEFDALFDGQGEKLIRERRHLLSSIQPEPVEFSAYHGRNWRRLLLWPSVSLLGVVALIAQIGWFQFDTLSRHQPYRSVYSAVCPLLKCQVPALAAPELIRTSNLVVRSHPQAEGALVVDTILLNTASFSQPFPELTLTFSNRYGETVASRSFLPGEYLAGELAGHRLMPSNQPIHLTLEILDPGPDAVGYSASIPN